jgi:nucleoside-diphosphate-sugar epimerase
MVIGNGMIANEFMNYHNKDEFIIFASGVSDSTHSPAEAFERERKLLVETIQAHPGKRLVYFSTCSIYDASMRTTPYVIHKKQMEELILANHREYMIFRLSNPAGKTGNSNTVFNFFIKNILEKQPFEVWKNASRNIIDIDDMCLLCNEILQQKLFLNTIINIANPKNYSVPYIIIEMEKHFGIKGNYKLVDTGDGPHIDTTQIEPLFRKFNINFDVNYLSRLLKKYFPVNDI